MRHAFIDEHADLDTPLHRLRPKVKIIIWGVVLVLIVLTPWSLRFMFISYGVLGILLLYLSQIPPIFMVRRLVNTMPFIILVTITALFRKQGLSAFVSSTVKATLATLFTLLIASTTKFTELLVALKDLGVPDLLIWLFSFMYRYSFVLEDQLLRISRAYESRSVVGTDTMFHPPLGDSAPKGIINPCPTKGTPKWQFSLEKAPRSRFFRRARINKKARLHKLQVLSNILGVIFIRTYERAERIYLAMCARGYSYEKGD